MSFAIPVIMAALMRSEGFGWGASLITAAYFMPPFIVWLAYAAFMLRRRHRLLRHIGSIAPPDSLRAEARRLRAAGKVELAEYFEQAAIQIGSVKK